MRSERLVVALALLAIAGGLAWGAWRLFQHGPTTGRQLGGVACGLGAAFMGVWALNLLTA